MAEWRILASSASPFLLSLCARLTQGCIVQADLRNVDIGLASGEARSREIDVFARACRNLDLIKNYGWKVCYVSFTNVVDFSSNCKC